MMAKTELTLLILAAGIGSRYGGLKQLDAIGPNGECLLEYSIFDAVQSGFTRVILVIRPDYESVFKEQIIKKWESVIDIDYVFQTVSHLPHGVNGHEERVKPWGTGHAIWVARDKIDSPFTVINADDFYGRKAFQLVASELIQYDESNNRYCLVAYQLKNTLSEHGFVSRGICSTENQSLASITEYTEITADNGRIFYTANDKQFNLAADSLVSMNFWGFEPSIFNLLEEEFKRFLIEHSGDLKSEFFISYPIDRAIKSQLVTIGVMSTTEKWMGVTYQQDRQFVKNRLNHLISEGVYPIHLVAR